MGWWGIVQSIRMHKETPFHYFWIHHCMRVCESQITEDNRILTLACREHTRDFIATSWWIKWLACSKLPFYLYILPVGCGYLITIQWKIEIVEHQQGNRIPCRWSTLQPWLVRWFRPIYSPFNFQNNHCPLNTVKPTTLGDKPFHSYLGSASSHSE